MPTWTLKPLGDVCTLQRGFDLPTQDRRPGTYPLVSSSGVIDTHDEGMVSGPGVVTGRSGSIGNVFYVEEDFWPLNTTLYVRDFHRNDPRFVYYLLAALDLRRFAGGTGVPTLNRNDVHCVPVQTPGSVDEQRRIVAILDEAFEGIATAKAHAEKNLRNARELFETLHQSVFANAGEGWVEQKLGDIASFRNGLNYTKQSKGQTVRIIGVKDFQNHFWAPIDDLDCVTLDGELSETDSLVEGDILSVRSNGNPALIGRCMLVGVLSGPVSHSGFTIRIRLHRSGALPQYVCQFLKSQEVRKKLVDGGNGANIKSLNQGTLAAVVVPLPPVEIQQKLVARIEAMSDETNRLAGVATRKLAALDELKQSLLHQAFSGAL